MKQPTTKKTHSKIITMWCTICRKFSLALIKLTSIVLKQQFRIYKVHLRSIQMRLKRVWTKKITNKACSTFKSSTRKKVKSLAQMMASMTSQRASQKLSRVHSMRSRSEDQLVEQPWLMSCSSTKVSGLMTQWCRPLMSWEYLLIAVSLIKACTLVARRYALSRSKRKTLMAPDSTEKLTWAATHQGSTLLIDRRKSQALTIRGWKRHHRCETTLQGQHRWYLKQESSSSSINQDKKMGHK